MFGKTLAVVDAEMAKFAHIQHVVTAQAVGEHYTVRSDFLLDNWQQGVGLHVFHDHGIDLAPTLEDAENDDFSGSPASPFALSFATEITLVQFHRAVKDFVGFEGEMPRDDRPDFSIKQGSGIGIDASKSAAERAVTSRTKYSSSFR